MKKKLLSAVFCSAALILPGQAQEPSLSGTSADLLFPPATSLCPSVPAPSNGQSTEDGMASPSPAESPESPAAPVATPMPVAPTTPAKGTAAQLRASIRMRQIKTELLADATLQKALARAQCAKTKEGHRVLMRNYYTMLYGRIEKIDPSVFEVAERELHDALLRYEQHNIRPSVLIEPGIKPLPHSCAADHEPGKCTPPSTPTPMPTPTPAPASFATPVPAPLP